ncbi:ABC transporter substrate-binding protein [Nocardioides albus]|nr:ABC transporter substrate-binding protein [Nocardioides albus]
MLQVASPADISSLDPIRGNSGSDHVMLYPMYATLISFDKGLTPQPGLAESWEQKSPTELVLHLRKGVTFHDDTPFDAGAVKYNLERALGPGSNIAPDIAAVKQVRVDDAATVTLLLSQPDSSIVMALADRAGMMVSPTAAEKAGGDMSADPVGAGPWKFVEWRRGSLIRYERFADYWDKEATVAKGLDIAIMPDPKTRVTSLRSGQQDIALMISPEDAQGLENASGVELEQNPQLYLDQIYFNRSAEGLRDPRVRRALSLAIDRESILKSAYFGRGQASSAFMPHDYWASPPDEVDYPYDPAEAKKLLAAAGATGLTFDMIANANSHTVRLGEIIKEQWAAVGVTVNIRPLEVVQASNDYFNDRKAPALLSAWTGRPDPAMTYRLMFTDEAYFNTSDEGSPGLAEAFAKVDEATTPDERKPGLDEAATAVYEDTPVVPLVFPDSMVGLSDDVTGFENNLLGKPKFVGISFQ